MVEESQEHSKDRYLYEPDDQEQFDTEGYAPIKENVLERPYKVRKSVVILIWQLLVVVILFSIFQIGFDRVLAFFHFEDRSIGYISIMELKTLMILTLNILVILAIILRWAYQFYVISSKEFSKHSGIIQRSTWTTDIASIQVLRVHQGIVGRIFKYGSINMEIKLLDYDMHISNIPNPHMYASLIEEYKTGGNINDAKLFH